MIAMIAMERRGGSASPSHGGHAVCVNVMRISSLVRSRTSVGPAPKPNVETLGDVTFPAACLLRQR